MAITINQQPISGVFAGSPMVYAVSSNNSGNAGFKYVADVFIWFGNSASVPVSYTYRLIKRKESVSNLYGYFDVKAMADDVVAVCKACGLIGAIDAQIKEVNGMVFRVTCRTNSYKISE